MTSLNRRLIKKLMLEQDDPYHIGEESDSDDERGGKSSDEELDEYHDKEGHIEASATSGSEDDFEKEMQMDLDAVLLKNAPCEAIDNTAAPGNSSTLEAVKSTEGIAEGSTSKEEKPECYDEDYFSSGSEDEDHVGGVASKSFNRRKLMTDEDLFYDPDMDDEDAKWVLNQREEHRKEASQRKRGSDTTGNNPDGGASTTRSNKQSKSNQRRADKPPTSDAILSCPACMTTVCIDCQRHEIYQNQYRAMFVINCTVAKDEVLKYQEQRHFGKRRKGKNKGKLVSQESGEAAQSSTAESAYEAYNPVKCTECGTEVAVYDRDEVYHFFNILTSYA